MIGVDLKIWQKLVIHPFHLLSALNSPAPSCEHVQPHSEFTWPFIQVIVILITSVILLVAAVMIKLKVKVLSVKFLM